jgi:hypothetical protein
VGLSLTGKIFSGTSITPRVYVGAEQILKRSNFRPLFPCLVPAYAGLGLGSRRHALECQGATGALTVDVARGTYNKNGSGTLSVQPHGAHLDVTRGIVLRANRIVRTQSAQVDRGFDVFLKPGQPAPASVLCPTRQC